MNKSNILAGGNGRCPANCLMTISSEQKPTKNFRILNENLIEQYETTAILALDNETIAGFVNFYPTWCPHFDICNDEQINEAMTYIDDIKNPPPCEEPALHVRCLIVRPEYRGHGLAVQLLEYLKNWAKEKGWRKLVANGCIFSGRAQYQWLVAPKPPKPIWEKAGFSATDYKPLGLKAISSEENTRQSFEWKKTKAPEWMLLRVSIKR
jgi:GNAT superfamily N-acetyltransferase